MQVTSTFIGNVFLYHSVFKTSLEREVDYFSQETVEKTAYHSGQRKSQITHQKFSDLTKQISYYQTITHRFGPMVRLPEL